MSDEVDLINQVLTIPKEKLIVARSEGMLAATALRAAEGGVTAFVALKACKWASNAKKALATAKPMRADRFLDKFLFRDAVGVAGKASLVLAAAVEAAQYAYENYCRHDFMDIDYSEKDDLEFALEAEAPALLSQINEALYYLKKYDGSGWLPSQVTSVVDLLVCFSNHDSDVIKLLGIISEGSFKHKGIVFISCDNEMTDCPMPDVRKSNAADYFNLSCIALAAAGFPAYATHVGECSRSRPINACPGTKLRNKEGAIIGVPQYVIVSPDMVVECATATSGSMFYSGYFVNKVCLYLMAGLATMGLVPLGVTGNGFAPIGLNMLRGSSITDDTVTIWRFFGGAKGAHPFTLKAITRVGLADYNEQTGNSFGLNFCKGGYTYVAE